MKNCANCKLFFHINCLEENEVKRKYTCDRCRIDCVGQTKALKKHKKLDEKYEKEVDKAVLKKIEK
jgi:aldehyde:ferredoxin oxidoreductase